MMDFSDVASNVIDQDRGAWFEAINPWDGTPTGMKFLIAGPDSATQRRARIEQMDHLVAVAQPDGTASFEDREKARVAALAKCIKDWVVQEDGHPLPFTHKNAVRLLGVTWLQAQIDSFAGDRSPFRPEA